jgi:hypothetical protein
MDESAAPLNTGSRPEAQPAYPESSVMASWPAVKAPAHLLLRSLTSGYLSKWSSRQSMKSMASMSKG